jgi:hypothetical protein
MRTDLKKETAFHFMSFTCNKVTLLCGLSKISEPDPHAGLSSILGISAAYVCVLDGTLLHILCILTNTWRMKAPFSFSEGTGIGTDRCNLRGGWTSEIKVYTELHVRQYRPIYGSLSHDFA